MGRPRTIAVSPDAVLLAIASATARWPEYSRAHYAELKRRERAAEERGDKVGEDWSRAYSFRGHMGRFSDGRWLPYNLDYFSGQPLSDSQRVTWRRVIRGLYDLGYVDLDGRRATHVRLTDLGRAHLASLATQLEAGADA